MKVDCPQCRRELRSYKERRFGYGFAEAGVRYEYRILYRYACTGNAGCQHCFVAIQDIPELKELSPRVTLVEEADLLWKMALKNKPAGLSTKRTTVGAFSMQAHCDTAEVWQSILKRFGYPVHSQSFPA